MSTEETLKEKLARVERLENRFSDSFMAVQAADSRIADIEKSIKDIQSKLLTESKLNIELMNSLKSQTEKNKLLESNIGVLFTRLDQQKDLHDKHFDKYLTISKLESTSENLLNRIFALEKKQDKYAIAVAVAEDIKATNRRYDLLDNCLAEIRMQIQCSREDISRLTVSQNPVNKLLDSIKTKLEVNDVFCNVLSESLSALKTECESNSSKLLLDVFERIDRRIKEKLPTIDENRIALLVKELIKTEIANISVDSNNANLKYNNIDGQVKLLEKKIENLFLLLKKAEISKAT
jgi:hypothetical protein